MIISLKYIHKYIYVLNRFYIHTYLNIKNAAHISHGKLLWVQVLNSVTVQACVTGSSMSMTLCVCVCVCVSVGRVIEVVRRCAPVVLTFTLNITASDQSRRGGERECEKDGESERGKDREKEKDIRDRENERDREGWGGADRRKRQKE